jgi:hypothetical protein
MTMCKLCYRKIFVGRIEKPEVEKLSGGRRNMWKFITMSVGEEFCAHVVWIHVARELGTTE